MNDSSAQTSTESELVAELRRELTWAKLKIQLLEGKPPDATLTSRTQSRDPEQAGQGIGVPWGFAKGRLRFPLPALLAAGRQRVTLTVKDALRDGRMGQGVVVVKVEKLLAGSAQHMAKAHQPLAGGQRQGETKNEKTDAPDGRRVIPNVRSLHRDTPAPVNF